MYMTHPQINRYKLLEDKEVYLRNTFKSNQKTFAYLLLNILVFHDKSVVSFINNYLSLEQKKNTNLDL